jgi:geranylgeranyl reductase family protein
MANHMTYDVLVVGGGPAGLYAASRLAHAGFAVVVCEEHEAIGEPAHCTGVLSAGAFDELRLNRSAILNALTTVRFVSPSGLEVRYTPPITEAVVIDRVRFDQQLACQAQGAGAELKLGTRVTSLQVTPAGVKAQVRGGEIKARLAVLASGASYTLQRRLGLGLPRAYLHTAQREITAERLGDVEIHFGRAVAPAGFAWVVPIQRSHGLYARVGVMAGGQPARWYERMVARLTGWGVAAGTDRPRLKYLPLRSISRTYDNRVLAIGDAAGLVKPTTGGGIYYSIVSAALAADVAADALQRDRLAAASLRVYESRWRRRLAAEFQAQWVLRRIAEKMTDRQIDALFELALTDGVMPIVQRTASFNHHRPLIHALLRHAPARQILRPAKLTASISEL